jgi:hypothetical protein
MLVQHSSFSVAQLIHDSICYLSIHQHLHGILDAYTCCLNARVDSTHNVSRPAFGMVDFKYFLMVPSSRPP